MEFDMCALFRLIINLNKYSSLKAKARTKDSSFVLKDNQGSRTKAKDNIPGIGSCDLPFRHTCFGYWCLKRPEDKCMYGC